MMNDLSVIFEDLFKLFLLYFDLENDIDITNNIFKTMNIMILLIYILIYYID